MAADPDELAASDDLLAWIDALRRRVAQGEFDAMPSVGRVARLLLADLDHETSLTPEERREPSAVERRRALLADLRRLRERSAMPHVLD